MSMLPDFRLETYFSEWEFAARYHLTASDAQTMSLPELLELADEDGRARWESLQFGYTEPHGLPALREAIAATYDHVSAEEILCFAGAEEALYLAMQVLLNPDDHAVVVTPNYQAAETVPLSICEVTGVALRPEDNWALNLDALNSALRPNTRLVSVNFPNNPTGAVPDKGTWRALVELCDERGIHLFSDEVYRGLELNRDTTLAQAADLSPKALSLNVLSKAYGLPGLRIGWIACRDPAVLDRLERAKHYTSICNSAPSEILGLIALRAGDQILRKTGRSLPTTFSHSTTSSPAVPPCSSGRNLRGVASPILVTSVTKEWNPCAPNSSKKPEFFCYLPASTTHRSPPPPLIGSGSEWGAAVLKRPWMPGLHGWTNADEPDRHRTGRMRAATAPQLALITAGRMTKLFGLVHDGVVVVR